MVSKITLFEPHFDGAQIGPASLGSEVPGLTSDESEIEQDTDVSEPSAARRRPSARTVIGIAGLAAGLLGGFLAWRRFRSGSKTATDKAAESTDEPMIEERPVEDITAE